MIKEKLRDVTNKIWDRISGKRVYDQFDWISFLNGKIN